MFLTCTLDAIICNLLLCLSRSAGLLSGDLAVWRNHHVPRDVFKARKGHCQLRCHVVGRQDKGKNPPSFHLRGPKGSLLAECASRRYFARQQIQGSCGGVWVGLVSGRSYLKAETWMWHLSMRHHETICLRILHTDSTWFSWEHPSWLMHTDSRRARRCKGFPSLLHCLIVRQTPNSGFPSRNIRNVGLAIPT